MINLAIILYLHSNQYFKLEIKTDRKILVTQKNAILSPNSINPLFWELIGPFLSSPLVRPRIYSGPRLGPIVRLQIITLKCACGVPPELCLVVIPGFQPIFPHTPHSPDNMVNLWRSNYNWAEDNNNENDIYTYSFTNIIICVTY